MKRLSTREDYIALFDQPSKVPNSDLLDVKITNLGYQKVETNGKIDYLKLKEALYPHLLAILKERIGFLNSWEIYFKIHRSTTFTDPYYFPFASRNIKILATTLARFIVEAIQKDEDVYAVQVYLKKEGSATYDNFVFFVG